MEIPIEVLRQNIQDKVVEIYEEIKGIPFDEHVHLPHETADPLTQFIINDKALIKSIDIHNYDEFFDINCNFKEKCLSSPNDSIKNAYQHLVNVGIFNGESGSFTINHIYYYNKKEYTIGHDGIWSVEQPTTHVTRHDEEEVHGGDEETHHDDDEDIHCDDEEDEYMGRQYTLFIIYDVVIKIGYVEYMRKLNDKTGTFINSSFTINEYGDKLSGIELYNLLASTNNGKMSKIYDLLKRSFEYQTGSTETTDVTRCIGQYDIRWPEYMIKIYATNVPYMCSYEMIARFGGKKFTREMGETTIARIIYILEKYCGYQNINGNPNFTETIARNENIPVDVQNILHNLNECELYLEDTIDYTLLGQNVKENLENLNTFAPDIYAQYGQKLREYKGKIETLIERLSV